MDIPEKACDRREFIKFRLRVAGYTFSKLADELGMSRNSTHVVLWAPYPRLERIVAQKIGIPPHLLWPERYDENGEPNRPMGRPKKSSQKSIRVKSTKTARLCNVKKREAA